MIESHPSGGYILDELVVGMTAEKRVTVTEERIGQFAEASDDFNPLHMDAARGGLHCQVLVGDEIVMDGDATVRVPRRRRPAKT